jgi:uncharacterized membrane protein
MRHRSTLRLLGATALAFTILNQSNPNFHTGHFGLGHFNQAWQLQGDHVEAKARSSGRARGGSFTRKSSPSRNSSPSNGPSFSAPSSTRSNSGPIIIHSSSPYHSTTSSSSDLTWFWILLGLGIAAVIVVLVYRSFQATKAQPARAKELQNNIVTLTQLQIALLAQAKQLQTDLTELALNANTETSAGLTELLREVVLALLRSPENWSHVRVMSQTVKTREEAAQRFEQLSIAERSKVAAETLVNVGGHVRQQAVAVDRDGEAEPSAYIVVTLLIGTEDDQPLLKTIHSTEELTTALKQLASISPDYLLIFELLWNPQNAQDSLSRDELLVEYPDLIQLG